MKAIRLLIAALLITTAASANNYEEKARLKMKDREPGVLFIVNGSDDESTAYEFDSPGELKEHLRERERCRRECKDIASMQLSTIQSRGSMCTGSPAIIFTQKENKFSFGIGGYVNFRTSYDFSGVVRDVDFTTADIPIPGSYATRQQFMMDASASRVFFTAVANTRALGAVSIYADVDFRGDVGYGVNGVTNSYIPRVRSAYVSFLGLTIGADITTFYDKSAAPQTIDYEGPNALAFNFATLIRYEYTFCDDHLTAAIALEQPGVSGTYDTTFEPIPQRMPDVPIYLQYEFGYKRQNHIRASAVFRDMYAYNATTGENTSLFGWGVQASGRVQPVSWMGVRFSGIYGEGITPYIQDLIGLGLDFTPNPDKSTSLQTMPMYAWQAAANFNITDRLVMNGGYSMVQIQKENGYYSDDEYRKAQYIFGNLFYSVTPRMQVAAEYLYGKRCNMDGASNGANRVSLMAQYNF